MTRAKVSFNEIAGLSVLVVGLAVGVVLAGQKQLFSQKASGLCPMTPQCPGADGVLRYCAGGGTSGRVTYGYTYVESRCDRGGKRSTCGSDTYYCCPVAGGAWTTDLSKCPIATPVGSPKPVRTISPVGTPVRVY